MLPRAYQINTLPRWAYFLLSALCACMGFWASYITLQYFEHGAKALETDVALQGLAVAAALMFVASEMAAFSLAALLTEKQLWARRWQLYAFAGAVLALEVCTIVAVQMALTVGADMTQTSVSDTVADLQKQIATAEANAKTYTATAESLRAADQLKKALAQTDKATAESAKASQLYDRLALARTQKRPTMAGMLGEKTALAYAVARGVLVSLGGLVFFGVAGALLRAGRGGTMSTDQQILELLHEIRGTPGLLGAPVAPAQTVAPAAAPALASFKPVGTVAPAGVPTGLSYGSKMTLAGAGALAAMAAPMAQAAPVVTAPNPAHTLAPTAPNPAHSLASTAPESAHTVAPTAPELAQKRKARKVQGVQLDTGTTGLGAARYNRIKAAVMAGKLTPSTRAIQGAEGGSGDVVRAYLQQLEKDGVTVRKGRGYVLAK
jgi:hypothetical protein